MVFSFEKMLFKFILFIYFFEFLWRIAVFLLKCPNNFVCWFRVYKA